MQENNRLTLVYFFNRASPNIHQLELLRDLHYALRNELSVVTVMKTADRNAWSYIVRDLNIKWPVMDRDLWWGKRAYPNQVMIIGDGRVLTVCDIARSLRTTLRQWIHENAAK
jgi:hypothetical protein